MKTLDLLIQWKMCFLEHYEMDDFYSRFETAGETPLAANKTFTGGF